MVIKPSAVIHSQGEVQLPSCLLLSPWICLAQASEHLQMGKGVVLSCALEMAYTVKQWFTNSIFIKEMCEISLPASFPSPDCSFPAARAVTVCPSVQRGLSPRPPKPSAGSRVAASGGTAACAAGDLQDLLQVALHLHARISGGIQKRQTFSVHTWQLQRPHVRRHGSVDAFLLSCCSLPQTVASLIRLIYRAP